ncbi:Bifunctional purine biosynthesis protein PurH [Includes: Phosphoribosylaminoimidazolecarboxamide formyltransferase (AICAR transformylase), partial [Durusdinium trenchii]
MSNDQSPRALISVSDKRGLDEFAKGLYELGFDILSTGGTSRFLQENGIPVTDVSDYTGFPEIMGGRVKTLHPKVHGAILGRPDLPDDAAAIAEHEIHPLTLVVCNLYPFEQTIARENVSLAEAIEQIDIGGPSMLRSAAKNHAYVGVVTDPEQYPLVLERLQNDSLDDEFRRELACAAFTMTANYDRAISDFFSQITGAPEPASPEDAFAATLELSLKKQATLRYGENPHQRAALYVEEPLVPTSVASATKRHGKELSFNNLLDLDAALAIVAEFEEPASVVIKHNNPCGCAIAGDLALAYRYAHEGDPVSAFGSILGFNREVDLATAELLCEPGRFIEAIIAPGYSDDAFELLTSKPRWKQSVRLLECPGIGNGTSPAFDYRRIRGGMLIQDVDAQPDPQGLWKVVTTRSPSEAEMRDLRFGWLVAKHVKSNAIVLAKEGMVVGVGAGQMSRLDSSWIAAHKAGDRSQRAVVASDAFFPFRDGIDEAAKAGVTAAIQPGGSKGDEEVIAACNEHNIAMIFTGTITVAFRARQRLGKYRIEKRLSEGGFATVYQDFRTEVRLAARLDHPHILALKDASVIDDHLVIAFPLGQRTLADRLQKRLSLKSALEYAEQILDALAYAHEQRIIHCDVKPENMVLFEGDHLRLTDFGIAKIAMKTTVRGSGTGTIGYMAPEQAMGKPSQRSDVFSAGLIVYRMLAGEWPEWPYEWPPAGYARLRSRAHPDLIPFLRKAIDPNPRKRFRDATQMRNAFARLKPRVLNHGTVALPALDQVQFIEAEGSGPPSAASASLSVSPARLRTAILEAVESANEELLNNGGGSASTLALIELTGTRIRTYHVGDSAILVVGQRGRLKRQTVCHSPVGYALEAGLLDEEEALYHEERHVVSNVVGISDMRIELGPPLHLASRDTVLLATDGLYDNLWQDEIVEAIRKGPLQEGVHQLISLATRRMLIPEPGHPSKPDDLSVVAFRLKPPKRKRRSRKKAKKSEAGRSVSETVRVVESEAGLPKETSNKPPADADSSIAPAPPAPEDSPSDTPPTVAAPLSSDVTPATDGQPSPPPE